MSEANKGVYATLEDFIRRAHRATGFSFLDASYGGTSFAQGPGRILPRLTYAGSTRGAEPEKQELLALARARIERHRGPAPDTRSEGDEGP